MRTVLSADWVVGFDGEDHILIRNGHVLVEGDRIAAVGPENEWSADETYHFANQVLLPGLIDTHVHIGTRATHRLITDNGADYFYGQPFLHWAVTAPGAPSPGGDGAPPDGSGDSIATLFTAAELLRAGVTTFVEVGSNPRLTRAMAEVCTRLGLRAFLGPGVASAYYAGATDKKWDRILDLEREKQLLNAAETFIEEHAETDDLVHPTVVARELENCRPELLRTLHRLAESADLPFVTHAAYNPIEWQIINQEYGLTPIQYLDSVGALSQRVLVEHGNFIAENNPFWSGHGDLKLLSQARASVSHSPVNLLRRGRKLDSLTRYLDAGVNMCLGADTYPRDLFMQMRAASYMAKAVTSDYRAGDVATVFRMATNWAADALGRQELGRIRVGAKADIISVRLRPRTSLRMGVVRDPVAAVVECAVGDDVDFVMVNGEVRVRNGELVGVDVEQLLDEAQADAERYWSTVASWHHAGLDADQAAPYSFSRVS